ncbi:YrbL family protein [Yoonia algicola]|uniref:YrbL family protein n=1 Tax=Yoonia algicola TaxID=3137368 RepID=A0AAN0M5M3_9RHOB
MHHVIKLSDSDHIASGGERDVYQHPSDPTKLLKVLRNIENQRIRFTFRDISTWLFPDARLRLIRKEYDEYLRIRLRYPAPQMRLPITHLYGLAPTNRGLACVAERVSGAQGGVGETMRTLIQEGRFTENELGLFNVFVKQIYTLGIRAGDLKPHNLVFGYRDAGYECVLVDGFGDVHALPVRSIGRWANAIGLHDSFKIIAKRTGLRWDRNKRSFQLAAGE